EDQRRDSARVTLDPSQCRILIIAVPMASSRGLPCRKERLREVTHLMGQHERVDVHHLECLIPRNELMIFGDAGSCLRAAGVDTRVARAVIAAGSYNDPLIYLIWRRG